MPNTDFITVSQKIEDKKEQERLLNLVKRTYRKENGAIIRTSAVKRQRDSSRYRYFSKINGK